MNKHLLIAFTIIFATVFTGCDLFEYNVYESNRYENPIEATNEYNIGRLLQLDHKDTLYLVFTGDPQRYYNELEDMVKTVNGLPRVDAVFVSGDLIEFGTSREYEWICEHLIKLKSPFLTVIGNHDCLATGVELYQQIYGPLNYSFTWNKIRFVIHNTNSRQFNFNGNVPDLQWMQQSLSDVENYEYSLFMCHVPPNHEDFDVALQAEYTHFLRNAKNTILVANGHRHNSSLNQPYNDGIWFLNTSSPSKRELAYVKIYTTSNARKKFDCTFISF